MTITAVNLIVALPPEAKPINRYLGLVRDNHYDLYPLYRREQLSLVISGHGAENSAAATTWLHQINNSRPGDIWINMGIAGHPTHEIGKALLADTIVDQANAEEWRLVTAESLSCLTARVYTVDKPDTVYKLDGLADMEAAGFYRSAMQCTTANRIHCLKVVSDNRDNPSRKINGKMVSQLIQERLNILDELIRMEHYR